MHRKHTPPVYNCCERQFRLPLLNVKVQNQLYLSLIHIFGISLRSLQNYRDNGKLGYSQIGNKMYYKAADIERLVAAYTENKKSNHK